MEDKYSWEGIRLGGSATPAVRETRKSGGESNSRFHGEASWAAKKRISSLSPRSQERECLSHRATLAREGPGYQTREVCNPGAQGHLKLSAVGTLKDTLKL
jgi:hypothetical protein